MISAKFQHGDIIYFPTLDAIIIIVGMFNLLDKNPNNYLWNFRYSLHEPTAILKTSDLPDDYVFLERYTDLT